MNTGLELAANRDRKPVGERIDPSRINVYSPVNGEKIGDVPSCSIEEALVMLNEVREAQKKWAKTPIKQRAKIMHAFNRLLFDNISSVTTLATREIGKPIFESYVHEALPILHLSSYFAKHTERILKPMPIPLRVFRMRKSYLQYRPRGVAFIIAPWNFPIATPMGGVIMNLMAGNGVLLKPASLTPLIAIKLRDLMIQAGLDTKLFQIFTGPGKIAEELIEKGSGMINFVTFTGSTGIGSRVSSVCGKHFIPCSMELGGNNAAIICSDADLELAARSVANAAFGNAGQECAAVGRAYAQSDIYDEFVKRVVNFTQKMRQGDPLKNPNIDLGCMSSENQLHSVEDFVQDAVSKGAKVLTGGKRSKDEGLYFEPTVLVNVNETMKVVQDETFGPVLPIMKFDNVQEAIEKANDCIYGLAGYVYTKNTRKGRLIAEQIEAGTVAINEAIITHAFPETPWQGVKASGVGKAHSDEGMRDLCYSYHVNYDVMRIPKIFWDNFWIWRPYSIKKISRFNSMYGIMFVRCGLWRKIGLLMKMI